MLRGFVILSDVELEIDVHLNYWCCTKKPRDIILDFGIMVNNANDFNSMDIVLPFRRAAITDLGEKMYRGRMMELIFNQQCSVTSRDEQKRYYNVEEIGNSNKFGVYEIPDYNLEINEKSGYEGMIMNIHPKGKELGSIKSNGKCYFRFRIKTDFAAAENVFTKTKTRASFLYSEIEMNEKLSIRINNPRDISENINELFGLEEKKYHLCSIQSVRMFVITSFENRIVTDSSYGQYTTRILENELWQEYAGEDINLNGELICHYWKTIANKKDMHYSFLCELIQKQSSWGIILVYLLALIVLDMFGSWLYEFFMGHLMCLVA